MTDEDDDYMSDKFLNGDICPSLIQNRAKKREVTIVHKHQERIKRQRAERREQTTSYSNEHLQEVLKRPIEAENKGFQLLAKMGYKPGQALGKETSSNMASNSKVLLEPIGISIKFDRGGLGREAALKELAEKRRQYREKRIQITVGTALTSEEFRKLTSDRAEERFSVSALRQCQLSCRNLDMESNVAEPEFLWFWPVQPTENTENDEKSAIEGENQPEELIIEGEEYTNTEKLDMLLGYLRTSYKFCYWCGERYKNDEDLQSNCPGLTRHDH